MALLLLLMHLPFARRSVFNCAAGYVERNLGLSVGARSIGYNLLGLRLTLKGISARRPGSGDLPDLLAADKIAVTFSTALLFRGKIQLKELEVINPRLNIVLEKEGETNLPVRAESETAKRVASEPVPPDIIVEHGIIQGADILYWDKSAGLRAAISALDLEGRWLRKGIHSVALQMRGSGEIAAKDHVLSLDGFSLKAELGRAKAILEESRLRIGKSELSLSGEIENDFNPILNLGLVGILDAAELGSALKIPGNPSGTVEIRSKLIGPLSALKAEGRVWSEGLSIGNLKDLSLDANYQWYENELLLPLVHITAAEGDLQARGNLHPLDWSAGSRLNLRWKSLDLAALMRFFGAAVGLSARTSGAADLTWNGLTRDAFKGKAQVQFLPGTAGEDQGRSVELSGFIGAEINAAGASLDLKDLKVGDARMGGEFQLTAKKIRGKFELDVPDLETFWSDLHGSLGTWPVNFPDLKDLRGRLNLAGDVSGQLKSPRLSAVINGKAITLHGVEKVDLSAQLTYEKKAIQVRPLVLATGEGEIRISGVYNIDSPGYVDFEVISKDFPGDAIVSSLGLAEFSRGKITFSGQLAGQPRTPVFRLQGSLSGFKYRDQDIPDIKIEAQSDGAEAKFSADIAGLSVRSRGSLSLQRPFPLRLQLNFDRSALATLGGIFPSAEEKKFSGTLSAEADLRSDLARFTETLNLNVQVEDLQVKAGDAEFSSSREFRVSYSPDGVAVRDLTLRSGANVISIEGDLPTKGRREPGIHLRGAVDLGQSSGFLEGMEGSGILTMDSWVTGSISEPQLRVDIKTSGADWTIASPPARFEDIDVSLRVADGSIQVQSLGLKWESGLYRLSGEIPFEALPFRLPPGWISGKKRPAHLSLSVAGFNPSDLGAVLGPANWRRVGGEIDAEVEISGDRLTLEDLSAAARFSKFEVDLGGIPIRQKVPARIIYRQGELTLETIDMEGKESMFRAAGSMDMLKRTASLALAGEIDLRMAETLLPEADVSGRADFDIKISGDLAKPNPTGFVEISDARCELSNPPLSLNGINGRIRFDGDRVTLTGIGGELNGGNITVEGVLSHQSLQLQSADIRLACERIFWDYPEGLFAEASAQIRFTSDGKQHSLGGSVTIETAEYVEDFTLQSELIRYLKRRGSLDLTGRPSPFLSRLNLNLGIETPGLVYVHNNLAKADVRADLRLVGTAVQPSLTGRILISEGGEINFSRTTYEIERGEINFANPARIEPDFNIQAATKVKGYDINLQLSGTLEDFSAALSSDPPLSEPDIISLLLTGQKLAYLSESGLEFVSQRAGSYVNQALTGGIEKFAEQKLGLQNVTIDAGLVSAEESPESRISVGQQIAPDLELVFSQNLKQAQDRTVILNYTPYRDLNLRAVDRENDAFGMEVHYEVRFGLKDGPSRRARPTEDKGIVGSVMFRGTLGLEETALHSRLKLTAGKKFRLSTFRKDLERLRSFYKKNGYLSCRIFPRREERDGRVDIVYRVESGFRIEIRYFGAAVPGKLRKEIQKAWTEARFPKIVMRRAREILSRHFRTKGHYQVRVEARESEEPGDRLVVSFQVFPGTKYERLQFNLAGNSVFPDDSLTSVIKKSDLKNQLFENPRKVVDGLENFYVQRGFLNVGIDPPTVEYDPRQKVARVNLSFDEGPQFKIGRIRFKGNQALSETALLETLKVQSGGVFTPQALDDALGSIRNAYAHRGFNQTDVRYQTEVRKDKGEVDLVWSITENRQDVIAAVAISGNNLTKPQTIRRELAFQAGEEMDYLSLYKTQKALYGLQIFDRVNFSLDTLETAQVPVKENKNFHKVNFNVSELNPNTLRLGFSYDTETGAGVTSEIVNRNLFGTARLAGLNLTLSQSEKGAKGFFRSQYFLGMKMNTELYGYGKQTVQPGYSLEKIGLTFQQQIKLKKNWLLTYNYTIERNRVLEAEEDIEASEEPINIGRLSAGLSRDTRNDIMNSTRGSFLSQNLEYAAPALGSSQAFVRSFSQYFFTKKLTGWLRYAAAFRLGLGSGFGEPLPLSERFFAGGGTSIRGFGWNEVGPKSPDSQSPLGGDALLIISQELRYPIYKSIGGVVFLDIGNVYPRVSDFALFSTRESAGIGLRLNTPIVLLRLDWGFKLDRRAGESAWEIHFNIGQAF
jgi:outer membrane protein assembly complex protein YaeT